MNEEKQLQIINAIDELTWDNEHVSKIMEGFFNSPGEVINIEKCSEEHLQYLWEILELEEI